jgi:hypothetical protein
MQSSEILIAAQFDTLAPGKLGQVHLRQAEVHLQRGQPFEIDHFLAVLDEIPHRDAAQADHARKRRAQGHLGQLCLGQRDGCLLHLELRPGFIECALRDELLLDQFLVALQVGLRQAEVGHRLLQFGRLGLRVEFDQHRALRGLLAVGETDRGDPTGHLRPQHHRIDRLQRTHGGNLIIEADGGDRGDLDRRGKAARRTTRRSASRCARLGGTRRRRTADPLVGIPGKYAEAGKAKGGQDNHHVSILRWHESFSRWEMLRYR